MKVNAFSKIGISFGALALVVGSFAVPAQADPASSTFGQLVGLGSDTTQDVVDGLAAAITPSAGASAPAGSLASYLATGSATVVTRSGAAAVPRASGSGSGRDMLRVAIGQTATASISASDGAGSTSTVTANKTNSLGMLDFDRSSSGPTTVIDNGVLTYIPFARDAVTVAVNPASPLAVVPFVLGSSSVVGQPSLYNIYRGDVRYAYVSGAGIAGNPYVYVGAGATNSAPSGSTAYAIQAYLPKSGSGTRAYFISKIGLSETNITTINTSFPNTVKSTYGSPAVSVEEHDGSVTVGDLTAINPYSISQWVAQANLSPSPVTDRRNGAILIGLGGVAATTGSGTSYATNPAYTAMVRDVYNIVPSRLADASTGPIKDMFVGSTSKVCQAKSTITKYGFALMPGTTAATTCGYTGLRAYDAGTSSTTLTFGSASVPSNGNISATVGVTSTHDQGGTVLIVNNAGSATVATYTLPAGQTSGTFTFAAPSAGEYTYHAEFVPTLTGIATSSSSNATVTVTAPTIPAAHVNISVKRSVAVGNTLTVLVYSYDGSDNGGTITLKNGGVTVGTAVTLEPGERAASFSIVAPKTPGSMSLTAEYTIPTGETAVSSNTTASATTVTVAKRDVATIAATAATVAKTVAPKVVVTLTGIVGLIPGGTVTVKEGELTVGTGTLVKGTVATATTSTVTVTLAKYIAAGTKSLTVVYAGDTSFNTATKTGVSLKITTIRKR